MPAAAKRKKVESSKASAAKKRKVEESPKKNAKKAQKKPEPAKSKKAAPASKVKKNTPAGNKAKTDTKAKPAANKKAPAKKNEKPKQTAKAKPAPKKEVKKSAPAAKAKPPAKKVENSKAAAEKQKPAAAAARVVTRKKVEAVKPKPKTAQASLAKAKLKAVKSLNKPKALQAKKEPVKPKVENKSKKEEEKKTPAKAPEKSKAKQPPKKEPEKPSDESNKRKATDEPDPLDSPRKKRVITPNKRYADYETDTSTKRISELRAFVQDKKKSPTPASPKTSKSETTPAKKTPAASKDSEDSDQKSPEIKVITTGEMKPAEKLLKKLQKKLEKEAKAAFAKPKQSPNKDAAKNKITKVVTYNKPSYSKPEVKQMIAKEKQLIAKEKPKPTKPAVIVKKKPATKPATNVDKVKAAPKPIPSPKKVREQKKDDRKIQTKFLFQKDVRQADDANTCCWITGIDIFKSGEIILIDMANKKIKLFSANFEYMSQAKLDTTPQDISISPLDAGLAFFTKPFSKEGIQRVVMSDGALTLKDSILTNGTNRGVKCIKAGILTSVQNGRYHDLDINLFKIDLLDYKGNVLKSVSMDAAGARLFKLPLYFTVSNNEKQIVVSDCIRNNSYILSLDMTGKIKFKFTGVRDNPITPRGLTTDDEDNVYVTEWERHNVYVLSPSGKRLQLLLDHVEQQKEGQDGLKKPYQLCYYKHEEQARLIVSQESCNTVKIFQISPKLEQNGATDAAKAAAETPVKPGPDGAAPQPASPSKVATPGTPTKPAAPSTPTKPATPDAKVAVVKPQVTKVIVIEKKQEEKVDEKVEEPSAGPSSPIKPPIEEPSSPVKPAIEEQASPVKPAPSSPLKAAQSSPVKSIITPEASSILSEEHAYTTLAAPAEKPVEPEATGTTSVSCVTQVTEVEPVGSEPAPVVSDTVLSDPVVSDTVPSDPMVEEGPEELSSIVDSIISNLNNRDGPALQPQDAAVLDSGF